MDTVEIRNECYNPKCPACVKKQVHVCEDWVVHHPNWGIGTDVRDKKRKEESSDAK